MLDRISLILVIIGAINWGMIGLFQFDMISFMFGGASMAFSRVLYTVISLAGLWCITLLFDRDRSRVRD